VSDPLPETTDPALLRRIELTGWSTVLLGFLCGAVATIQLVIPMFLDSMAEAFEGGDDPTRAMREALSAGAGTSALVNGAFGAALVVIGFAVSRRVRWAHPALTISGWASIVVLGILAKPTLAPLFALAGRSASGGTGMLLASAGLLAAQVVAVLWFLRFWRKPEVRAAFR
jgi:hypothetical protein